MLIGDTAASVMLERLLALSGPQASRVFALIALEFVSHPEQRAVDHGAIIASQVHDDGLDDEATEWLCHCPRPADPANLPIAVTCVPEAEIDARTVPLSATRPLKPANPGRVISPVAICLDGAVQVLIAQRPKTVDN